MLFKLPKELLSPEALAETHYDYIVIISGDEDDPSVGGYRFPNEQHNAYDDFPNIYAFPQALDIRKLSEFPPEYRDRLVKAHNEAIEKEKQKNVNRARSK